MEQKYKLKITGRSVCDVGYRPFLLVNAMNMGIKKLFAYNVKTNGQETVFVHISGDENKINTYIDFVKSNYPEHSNVDNIEVEEFEGDITDTIEFLQLLQFEQINKGIPAILNIDKKQDNIIDILKGVKEDTTSINEEISTPMKDLRGVFHEKYEYLNHEIMDMKASLAEIKAKAMV